MGKVGGASRGADKLDIGDHIDDRAITVLGYGNDCLSMESFVADGVSLSDNELGLFDRLGKFWERLSALNRSCDGINSMDQGRPWGGHRPGVDHWLLGYA